MEGLHRKNVFVYASLENALCFAYLLKRLLNETSNLSNLYITFKLTTYHAIVEMMNGGFLNLGDKKNNSSYS